MTHFPEPVAPAGQLSAASRRRMGVLVICTSAVVVTFLVLLAWRDSGSGIETWNGLPVLLLMISLLLQLALAMPRWAVSVGGYVRHVRHVRQTRLFDGFSRPRWRPMLPQNMLLALLGAKAASIVTIFLLMALVGFAWLAGWLLPVGDAFNIAFHAMITGIVWSAFLWALTSLPISATMKRVW